MTRKNPPELVTYLECEGACDIATWEDIERCESQHLRYTTPLTKWEAFWDRDTIETFVYCGMLWVAALVLGFVGRWIYVCA